MKVWVSILLAIIIVTAHAETQAKGFLKSGTEELPALNGEEQDLNKPFSDICRDKGYAFETHRVLTDDGYILNTFRIPGKKGETKDEAIAQHKPVIFLQHGILDSADTWIMHFEDRAPAFMLANQGYDVWLGNSRGTKHSREHQTLDPDGREDRTAYWDFSFEEMAQGDVTANIDYILKVTGKDKLAVMGHSQGTTQMLTRMALHNTWWNSRVHIFVCLAGVARLEHCTSSLITTFANEPFVIDSLKKIGINELLPANYLQSLVFSRVCKAFPFICNFFLQIVSDEDTKLNNQERIGVFMGHYPAGTSVK
jgi:lysosomal acid lipase/cholesteryl ester hydrolase